MLCSCNHSGSFVLVNTQLAAALAFSCALTACAAERASERPPATAATEPEQSTAGGEDAEGLPPTGPASLKKVHRALAETANTSAQIADKTAAQADSASEHGSVPGTATAAADRS